MSLPLPVYLMRPPQKRSLAVGRAGLWKASAYSGTGSLLDLSGNGNHAQFGSAAGADSNDPTYLAYAGTRYLYLSGVVGNYASVPDSAALSITGDIDLRAAVALNDWTPGTTVSLINKLNQATGDGQRAHDLFVRTDGKLQFYWSADGNTVVSSLPVSSVVLPVVDGGLLLMRAALDVDNGASGWTVTLYTKTSTESTAHSDLISHTGWIQLGTTFTAAGVTSIFDSNLPIQLGQAKDSSSGRNMLDGKYYAAAIFNGIGGTLALDADFTDPALFVSPFASFVEKSVNAATVTINRSSAGKKATGVDRSLILCGTDDYLEAADAASLDFAAGESFTVTWKGRVQNAPAASATILAKKIDISTGAGWVLYINTGGQPVFRIADGTNLVSVSGTAFTAGVLSTVSAVRDVVNDRIYLVQDGVRGTPVTDTTTGTLENAEVLRVARLSGAGGSYGDIAVVGAAIHRRVLSDAECVAQGAEL